MKKLRACWGIVFGDKKDGFFVLLSPIFIVIAVVIAIKFGGSRAKKALF